MTIGLRTFSLSAAALVCASPAFAIDPFFPEFGNNGIDVLHYAIELDVNPLSGAVDGETIAYIRAQRELDGFSLDLHKLGVSNVTVDGKPAAFAQANDKLTITLPTSAARGQVFAVAVTYAGVPEVLPDPTAPGDGLYLGWFKYKNSTYALSEPIGASTFFPANDEPTDRATFSIGVTVPEGYTGVANGALVRSQPQGPKRRFEWSMPQPMTTWLATVHVNKLSLDLSHAPDGTPVRIYTPEGVPQSHVEAYALAGQMLTYFESLVGRYPYASYGSIVVQDPILYYALETQAMSTFPAQKNPPSEALVAHELAHQWFGNSVSVARWEDLWIAEGIATYFEVLWTHRGDASAFHAEMRAIYDYVADQKLGPAVVEKPEQLFSDRTYYRGAAALYALRLQVGESAFFKILQRFAQDNRGQSVTSERFIRTAVQVSGDGAVRPLLKAWLYDEAVPQLPGRPRTARPGPVPRPDIIGGRCGEASHRGASRLCP